MDEETAITAQNENELSTEMTDAEMEAFVDKTLRYKAPVKDTADKKDDDNKDILEEKPIEEDEKNDKKIVVDDDEDPDEEQFEIPDVDTSDLWIEIEGFEADKDGNPQPKTFKINLEDGIPDDVRFKNEKQLAEVIKAMHEMESISKERHEEHDKLVKEQQDKAAADAAQKETMASWDDEIQDLIDEGLLDEPGKKPGEKGFMDDPSVKKIDAVFKFMTAENEKRIRDGKHPIKSFGTAFNLYTKRENAAQEDEKQKKDNELAKKRGAMIGGASGASGSGTNSQYVYKAGSAKSIWSVKTDDL